MNREFATSGPPPDELLQKEKPAPRFGEPKVKIHSPSSPDGWRDFIGSITKHVPTTPPPDGSPLTIGDYLDHAINKGVLVNQLRAYWEDLYRVDRPDGVTKEEYIKQNATWENSNIVEYPWKKEGRFVVVPKEEDFFRCNQSRQELIFSQDLQLSREKREALRRAKIKIGGLGVGGVAGYLLVLSGAQNLDVSDPGVLPPHKFNRFVGADTSLVGQPYVDVWGRAVLNLNPYLHFNLHYKKLAHEDGPDAISARNFMRDADVVVEEVDSFEMKDAMRRAANEMGIHLIMASDVETTSVLDVHKPGAEIWKGVPDKEKEQMATGSISDFGHATHLANLIIGPEHIPGDLLTVAAKLGQDYWPQDGGAAFISAVAVRDAIVAILSGEAVWAKTGFEKKRLR